MYREILQKLISNGHLRRLSAEEWFALTEEDCKRLYDKALCNPPLTFVPASLEQKNRLRSALAQGLLTGLNASDIPSLTADEAEFLLAVSEDLHWKTDQPYQEVLSQEYRDAQPATSEQLRQIRELIEGRFLRPLAGNTLLKISQLSAKRLIWRGEMNKREMNNVPHAS